MFILTEGTTTAFFPSSSSFITEVRALSDYEMMMGESKSQYLPYKKDDIKCNNFNLNANGLNVNAIPKPLSALRQLKRKQKKEILAQLHLATTKRDLALITKTLPLNV